jgi:hypothetical protein
MKSKRTELSGEPEVAGVECGQLLRFAKHSRKPVLLAELLGLWAFIFMKSPFMNSLPLLAIYLPLLNCWLTGY